MSGVRGITVDLANGKQLFAGYVPGRKSAGMGVQTGGTLNILAWFIGDAEYEAFRDEMQSAFGDGRWVLSIPISENVSGSTVSQPIIPNSTLEVPKEGNK